MSTADAKNQFRIERLSLRSFRQLALADIVFHPQFNYLIGGNGAGKTSVLDAVSYLLADLCGCAGETRYTVPTDPHTAMKARVYVKGQRLRWDLSLAPSSALVAAAPTDDRRETRPVIAWYGTYRTAPGTFTLPKRKKLGRPGVPPYTKAYDGCLPFHKKKTTVALLLSLLQGMPSSAYPDIAAAWGAALTAVRQCVPECEDLRVMEIREGTPEIIVKLKASGWFPLSRLGGGLRSVLTIALDLACRAAWLNPHAGARAVEITPGVVLIEDLETSLHPLEQRTIVSALQEAFPAVQFIATGHSPFILQSLTAGQAIDVTRLERREEDPSAYSIEDIVEDFMGIGLPQVSARQVKLRATALQYLTLAEKVKPLSEEEKMAVGAELDRLCASFKDYPGEIAFLKMKRYAAGIPDAREEEPQPTSEENFEEREHEDDDPDVPYSCRKGIAYPQPSGGVYADESIEAIAEEVMGVPTPKVSALRQKLADVSEEYYRRLDHGGFASEAERHQMRTELEARALQLSHQAAVYAAHELRGQSDLAKRKWDEEVNHEDNRTCEGRHIETGCAYPYPTGGEYWDKPIEDILEDVMGVGLPQMSKRRQAMKEAAQQYYEILKQGKDASEEEKARLSAELDELTAPFSDNVAYHAFLEMERIAAGLGKTETPKPAPVDAGDKTR